MLGVIPDYCTELLPLLIPRKRTRIGTVLRRSYSKIVKRYALLRGTHLKPVVYLFIKLKNTLDRSVQLVEP